MSFIDKFFTEQGKKWKIWRTIIAGIIGIIISYIPQLVSHFTLDPLWQPIIIGLVMAVLKPINDEIAIIIREDNESSNKDDNSDQEDVPVEEA